MKKNMFFCFIFLLNSLFITKYALAELTLGRIRLAGKGYQLQPIEYEVFSFEFGSITSSSELKWDITLDDIGKTFVASYGDQDFEDIRSVLTNGTNDTLFCLMNLPLVSGFGDTFPESHIVNYTGTSPDFIGSDITSISLTVNKFIWEYPVIPPDLPEPGETFNYIQYDMTLSIEGNPVPEPTSFLLLSAGMFILRKRI